MTMPLIDLTYEQFYSVHSNYTRENLSLQTRMSLKELSHVNTREQEQM